MYAVMERTDVSIIILGRYGQSILISWTMTGNIRESPKRNGGPAGGGGGGGYAAECFNSLRVQ